MRGKATALVVLALVLAAPAAHAQRSIWLDGRPLRAELRAMRERLRDNDQVMRQEALRNALESARMAREQARITRAEARSWARRPFHLHAPLLRERPLRRRHRLI